MFETKTASTPNILENHVSTIPMDSVCNSHFPERKSSLSTSHFCNSCWKKHSSHVLLNVVYMNLFRVARQFSSHEPGGSTKIRPAGPQRSFSEHSWQNVLLSFYDGRRRGRPPCSALVLPWLHRPKLPERRGCPPNKYPRQTHPPTYPPAIYVGHLFMSFLIFQCQEGYTMTKARGVY